jgi:hypothetical protein
LADSLAKILARALNIAVVARMAEPFLFFFAENWNGKMLYGRWSHGVVWGQGRPNPFLPPFKTFIKLKYNFHHITYKNHIMVCWLVQSCGVFGLRRVQGFDFCGVI